MILRRPSALLLLLFTVAGAFYPLFFGNFYALGDMRDVYIPLEDFFRQEIFAGRLPAWHPGIAWGYPSLASAQIGFYYPPSLILRFLPLPVFLSITLLFHLVFLSLGSYLFFRRLKFSAAAAAFAAASFSLGGFAILHLTHLNIIFALSWLPWLLLWFHHLATDTPKSHLQQSRLLSPLSLTISSLLIAIPYLAGQIQIPLFITLFSISWFIFLAWPKILRLKIITFVLLVAIISFALASAQLLPTLELLRHSSRASSSSFNLERANQYSYPLYHLPALLFPRFFGNDHTYWGKRLQIEHGFYLGTIPLLLATAYLIKNRYHSLPRPAKFFYLSLPITFLLALGDLSPFRIIGLEPSLWYFSAPSRWLLLTSFSLSVFAASGFDYLTRMRASVKSLINIITFVLIIFVCLANAFLLFIDSDSIANHFPSNVNLTAPDKLASLLISARNTSVSLTSPYTWLVLIALLLLYSTTHHRLPVRNLLIFTLVELAILAAFMTPHVPWHTVMTPPATYHELPASVISNQSRLHYLSSGGDTGAYFTNPSSRADAKTRKIQQLALVPLTHIQFGISGTSWPASLPLTEQTELLQNINSATPLSEINIPLAEQANVGAIISSRNNAVQITNLNPQARATLLLDNGLEVPANYHHLTPTSQAITYNAPTPATLIIRDAFYPGWHAYLEDTPLTLQPYQGFFRSASVPAGEHTVRMRYNSLAIQLGLTISLITALLSLSVLLYSSVKRSD